MGEKKKYAGSNPEKEYRNPGSSESETVIEGGRNEKPSLNYIEILFTGGLAGFLGFMISGLISRFAERADPGLSTEFGSFFSLGLSGALMIALWVLFTRTGLFKQDTVH